jgi:hypothetical protein
VEVTFLAISIQTMLLELFEDFGDMSEMIIFVFISSSNPDKMINMLQVYLDKDLSSAQSV